MTSFTVVDDEKKTLRRFIIRLIMEKFRWKNDDDQQASVTLVIKDNNDKREQQKQISRSEYGKQGPSCFKYEEVGHLKKDCFRCFICKKKATPVRIALETIKKMTAETIGSPKIKIKFAGKLVC